MSIHSNAYVQEPEYGWNRKLDVDYAEENIFGDGSSFRASLNRKDQTRAAYGHFDEASSFGLSREMIAAKLILINESLDPALRHMDAHDILQEGENFFSCAKRNETPMGYRSLMLGIETAKGRNAIPTVPIPDVWDWETPPDGSSKEYIKSRLSEMLDYAEVQLLKAGVPIYQYGERVVYVIEVKDGALDDEALRRSKGALITSDVVPLMLLEDVITHVKFHTIGRDGIKKQYIPTPGFANHLIARRNRWLYPRLNGIVEAPTLRSDGTLAADDGYDRESGLIINLRGQKFPRIAEHPTLADAMAALATLKEPFRDFPCIDGASRSVLLAAPLTGVVRRTPHSSPMFGFDAPTPGTGKSLAIDCVSMIVTSHAATIMSQGASEEEDEKRIFSALLKGDQTLVLDNVTRPIMGNALCSILTQPKWSSRVLGESRNSEVPCNVLAMSNGNNLRFVGDMTRRAVMCRMDAGMEHPEQRRFAVNLHKEVPRRRPQLVAAALRILRAYIVAGYPGSEKLSAFGSFEDWSRLIRGALVWLGEADPLETQTLITGGDTDRADFADLLATLGRHMAFGWWTVGDLVKAADNEPDLADAIVAEVPKTGKKAIGAYLAAKRGKIVNGTRLDSKFHTGRHVTVYRVCAEEDDYEW